VPTLRGNQIPRSNAGGRLSWLVKARRTRTLTLASINAISEAKGRIGIGSLNDLIRSFGNYRLSVSVLKSADEDPRALSRRIGINGALSGKSQGGVAGLNHMLGKTSAIITRPNNSGERSQLRPIVPRQISREPARNQMPYAEHARGSASRKIRTFEPSLSEGVPALANLLHGELNEKTALSGRMVKPGVFHTEPPNKSNLFISNPVIRGSSSTLTGHASRSGGGDSFRLTMQAFPDQSAGNALRLEGSGGTRKRRLTPAHSQLESAYYPAFNETRHREPRNSQFRHTHRHPSTAPPTVTINFNPTVELKGLPDTASKHSILDALSMHSHELILMIEQELAKHKRVEFAGLSPSTEARTSILS
jgi:hypothetical protein